MKNTFINYGKETREEGHNDNKQTQGKHTAPQQAGYNVTSQFLGKCFLFEINETKINITMFTLLYN